MNEKTTDKRWWKIDEFEIKTNKCELKSENGKQIN